ncbi:MAG: TIGR02147 family protein [Calothrix sp. SM1_5_4]|nr:TIGR02147 family protein [Calothrix sp. SM1_5_4]
MILRYDSIDSFLKDELRRRVRLNPRYSLRSFARNLRMSPGALSEVLSGRRQLSLKSVPNVAQAIGLSAVESRHLLHLAQLAKAAKNKDLRELERRARVRDEAMLDEQIFALVSEWYHFAILNLLECDGFEWKASWISRRLGISLIQARMAMDLLLRLGLVRREKDRYIGKNEVVLSPREIPSAAVRNHHRQILEKAIQALEGQALTERDITGSGFALDPACLPAIKKELSEFQDRLVAKYSAGSKTEVYFLEVALFKLTQGSIG